MRAVSLLPLLLLVACPMPKTEDSGDADADTDTDADADADTDADVDSGDSGITGGETPLMQAVSGECVLGECVYTVEADGAIGAVELSLVETGDPMYDTSCTGEVAAGDLACGVWSEYHNGFALVDDRNAYGGETKALDLEIVTDYTDVVQNSTTLFDLASSATSDQLTVMWVITDDHGNYADCAVYGDLPDYFASYCTNVW